MRRQAKCTMDKLLVWWLVRIFFLVASSSWLRNVRAQAPGDEDDFCLDISTAPAYAPSVKPLLDSWQYQSLLGEDGVWRALDIDNDNNKWEPIPSSICQEQVAVQEPLSLPQNNWLFTQHINKSTDLSHSYFVSIFVNVSYTFEMECEVVMCEPFVQLHYFLSNTIDSKLSINSSQYLFLANLTYNGEDQSSLIQFSTSSFSMAPEDVGFYLAVSDSGANVTIHRILAYRIIGPMVQNGLTLLPETPAPMTKSINVTGTCAANSNTSNGDLPTLTLSPSGTWTFIEPCTCIMGHYLKEIEDIPSCVACSPGTYKPGRGNEDCLPCPTNSYSSEFGAAVCTCLSSFYRSPDENAGDGCTGPPSFPRNVRVGNVRHTSANIFWNPPEEDGGRTDLFYNISYSLITNSIWVYPEHNRITETEYTLEGLVPCSVYFVLVTAENGVSAQAGEEGQRSVGTFLTTTKGTPTVTNVEVLEGVVVDWTPLTDQCVNITEYHVQFRVGDAENGSSFITVPKTKAVYEVNVTADLPLTGEPILVVVRAYAVETGVGEWSDPVLFAEVNPNNPTVPPTSIIPTPVTGTSKTGTSKTGTTKTESKDLSTTPTSDTGTTNPTTSSIPPTSSSGSTVTIILASVLAIVFIVLVAFVIVVVTAVVWWRFSKKPSGQDKRVKLSDITHDMPDFEEEPLIEEPAAEED